MTAKELVGSLYKISLEIDALKAKANTDDSIESRYALSTLESLEEKLMKAIHTTEWWYASTNGM